VVREEKASNVAGRDEEEKSDGGDEEEKGVLEIVDDDFVEGAGGHPEMLGIVFGIESDELIGDGLEIGSGGLARDVALDEAGGKEIHRFRFVEGLRERGRLGAVPGNGDVKIGAEKAETRRHDPDDGARFLVEDHGGAEDGLVGGESFFPEGVTEEDDGRGVGLRVLFGDAATEKGRNTPEVHGVGSENAAVDLAGDSIAEIRDVPAGVSDNVFKGFGASTEGGDLVEVVDLAKAGGTVGGVGDADDGEAGLVAIGKGIEEAVIEDAEDGGGETDAQGEGEDADDGEGGGFAQHTEGVAEILEEIFEESDVARFAAFLFGAFQAAKFETSAAKGFLGGGALGDEVVDVGVEVEAEFGVDFVFEAGTMAGGAEPGAEAAENGHRDSRVGY
jgi:hypothetical protein